MNLAAGPVDHPGMALLLVIVLILLLFGGVGVATDALWLILVGLLIVAVIGAISRL